MIAAMPAKIRGARCIVPVPLVELTAVPGGQRLAWLTVAVAAPQDALARGVFLADLEGAQLGRIAAGIDMPAPGVPLFAGSERRATTRRHRDHDLATFRIARLQGCLVGALLGVLVPAEAIFSGLLV